MNAQQILHYHQLTGSKRTLLFDDLQDVEGSGIAKLSEMGIAGNLWAGDHFLRDVQAAIVSKPRSARDLFRVLSDLERFITPGGTILVLPYTTKSGPENRIEATELFLGVHPTWERRLINGSTIELRKGAAAEQVVPRGKFLTREKIMELAAQGPANEMRRVISLALFGKGGGYWACLPAYVRAHHALFPGYELRIHHDDSIDLMPYGKALRGLAARGLVNLVDMAPDGLVLGKCRSMMWRTAPAWDPSVEYFFCRDLDSLPTWRERAATEEFIATGRDAHVIHDNPAHCGILGGLCGFRASSFRSLAPTFDAFIEAAGFSIAQWSRHGADQDYLNGSVRPYMTTWGHSLRVDGHNRDAAMGPIPYVVDIAPFDDPRVPMEVRERSETFLKYMGQAGMWPIDDVVTYYNSLPTSAEILVAERE